MTEDNHSPNKPFLQDTNRLSLGFGLAVGIAVFSTVWSFTLLAKLDGGSTKSTTTNTNTAQAAAANPTAQPTGPVDITVTKDDHIRGNANAKVTLVEFSDFQCPYCGQYQPTLQQLLKEYDGKIRVVYKHFPLESLHPQARPAALASECADEQGKFWEFHDVLFQNQQLLSDDFFKSTAKDLKLNTSKFNKCYDDKKFATKVDAQIQEGNTAGVTGTPSSFINGTPLSGAVPYATLKAQIDAALAAV